MLDALVDEFGCVVVSFFFMPPIPNNDILLVAAVGADCDDDDVVSVMLVLSLSYCGVTTAAVEDAVVLVATSAEAASAAAFSSASRFFFKANIGQSCLPCFTELNVYILSLLIDTGYQFINISRTDVSEVEKCLFITSSLHRHTLHPTVCTDHLFKNEYDVKHTLCPYDLK